MQILSLGDYEVCSCFESCEAETCAGHLMCNVSLLTVITRVWERKRRLRCKLVKYFRLQSPPNFVTGQPKKDQTYLYCFFYVCCAHMFVHGLYLRVYEVPKKKGTFVLTHILCKGDFTPGAKSQIRAQLSAKSSSFEEYEHKRAMPEHSSPSVHRTTFSNRLLCTRAKHAWSVSETPVPKQRIGWL